MLDVIRHAAPLDADIGALWERIQSDFYENQGAIVQSLADRGALAPGPRRRREATDILWTLNHPDLWQLLVGPARLDGRAMGAVVRRHEPARNCSRRAAAAQAVPEIAYIRRARSATLAA